MLNRNNLIELKRSIDEDLGNIMKTIEGIKNDIDRKIEFLMKMVPEGKVERITDGQIRYIKILYGKLGEEPPVNLNEMSKRDAFKLIDELKRRLGW